MQHNENTPSAASAEGQARYATTFDTAKRYHGRYRGLLVSALHLISFQMEIRLPTQLESNIIGRSNTKSRLVKITELAEINPDDDLQIRDAYIVGTHVKSLTLFKAFDTSSSTGSRAHNM